MPWRSGPSAAPLPPDAATTREILRRVKPRAAALVAASEPVVEGLARDVLVYWPAASPDGPARGSGEGVLIPIDELQRRDARVLVGELPADAIPVAPRLGLRAAAVVGVAEKGGFGLLAGLVVVLAGTLALGLTLALRGVRKEAALTRARADFLTSVTHELKTPLASIRLFSEMLLEGRVASDEKRREYHRLLAGEAERLSTLIENVLDLGRLERGERALDVREQELVEVVREMVERFAPLAQRDGMVVDAKLPEAPLVARFDRGALAQSLLNLLDNARKYARSGGRIDVALERGGGRAELVVRDFGPGVPERERAAIFEPFVRGAREQDGATPGLGLGLHLSRSLLRAQGGELALAPPDDGVGARFVATLPLAGEPPSTNGAAS
jgi:two-component system phosphate regulon sensor histidine kinase PhoR